MKSSLGSRLYELATSRARAAGVSSIVLVTALLVGGCRSTPTPNEPSAARPVQIVTEPKANDDAPAWIAEPLSWEKLHTVETWLATDGTKATPLWRIEGELVLNLGRLEFARREAAQKKPVDDATLGSRVRTARVGLEHVMADMDATPAQRRRAQDGITRSGKLLSAAAPRVRAGTTNGVVTRAMWGAVKPRVDRMDKTQGSYTRITVHHSADRDPVELDGSLARTSEAVREIQKAHMEGKTTHYGDIGYHFLVDPYGRLIEGRDLTYQGAHAYGDNNLQNIGICVIGNFDTDKPTAAALETLEREIEFLRRTYSIPKNRIYGHRELRSTDCPGDNLMKWVERYRRGK